MIHKIRWTSQKIAQRIKLIEPLVYRRREMLPDFRYITLTGPEAAPPVDSNVDDRGWETIAAHSYWGSRSTNFVLRTTFEAPIEWTTDSPVALYLPLGEAGDFSPPKHWLILTALLMLPVIATTRKYC